VVIQDPSELLPYPQAGLCRDRVRSYRDKVSNLYNGGVGAMSGRNEAGSEEQDVQGRKAAKENKTKSSESFSIRGAWEDIAGPTAKGRGGRRESSKRGGLAVPKKTKGMVVITSVRMVCVGVLFVETESRERLR
jgi:hypothetical protein